MNEPTKRGHDAALARQLGVSRAVVCRDKKRGMPTHSLEAARAWRERNLLPAMRKDFNAARAWHDTKPGTPAATAAALKRVADLMVAADALIDVGRFGLIEGELRVALAAVPDAAADKILVAPRVMDRLVAPVASAVRRCQSELEEAGEMPASAMSIHEAKSMGDFWLDAARGLVRAER